MAPRANGLSGPRAKRCARRSHRPGVSERRAVRGRAGLLAIAASPAARAIFSFSKTVVVNYVWQTCSYSCDHSVAELSAPKVRRSVQAANTIVTRSIGPAPNGTFCVDPACRRGFRDPQVCLIPRTAVLGAILLTGSLGGGIATHVRLLDRRADLRRAFLGQSLGASAHSDSEITTLVRPITSRKRFRTLKQATPPVCPRLLTH